jgi:hypothetical protein
LLRVVEVKKTRSIFMRLFILKKYKAFAKKMQENFKKTKSTILSIKIELISVIENEKTHRLALREFLETLDI